MSSRRRDGVKVAAYPHDLRTRVMRCPCLAVVLLVGVAALGTFRAPATLGLLVDGVTDEVAHLSMALLVLLAVAGPARLDRHRVEVATTLLASVAIHLDRLPLYAGVPGAAEGGRPASHPATQKKTASSPSAAQCATSSRAPSDAGPKVSSCRLS